MCKYAFGYGVYVLQSFSPFTFLQFSLAWPFHFLHSSIQTLKQLKEIERIKNKIVISAFSEARNVAKDEDEKPSNYVKKCKKYFNAIVKTIYRAQN